MGANSRAGRRRHGESGATLFIMAGGMVVLLSISALAIDLVSFYVARSEAQRVADAAALAGATIFVSQGCTNAVGGCVAGGPQEALARQQALDVAAQNTVVGQAPTAATVDLNFTYPSPEEPEITVTVHRDSAHSNAMPTFFAKILGITSADVSASATAEAFNPTGSNTTIGDSCIRPFLVPNCDPDHPVPAGNKEANPLCGASFACDGSGGPGTCYASYFFDPNNKNAIVNPGVYNPTTTPPSGGVVGEPWTLHSQAGPSQYYTIAFAGQSGSQYEEDIYTCVPEVISCSTPLNSLNGKKVGPTDKGIQILIHASGDGLNQGQDKICSPTSTADCPAGNSGATPPFVITGGSNNPNPSLQGKTFLSPSDSVASVVVYDGATLPSGGGTVNIIGYMQLFIRDVQHNATDDWIDTVIMSLGSCGTTGGPPPVQTVGGSPIPIRLIHP